MHPICNKLSKKKEPVYVDNTENTAISLGTIATGEEGWKNVRYNLERLTPGEHQVYLALTADNAETVKTEAKAVTFTKKAAEPTFELTAQNVTVQLPAEKIEIAVTVKNTSEVAAQNVVLNLWNNGVIATQTIDALAAGEEKEVTFTFPIAAYETGTASFFVQVAGQAQTEVSVTFKEEPVPEVIDLAITAIQGSLSLDVETNYLTLFVQNNGNVDVNDAPVTMYAGEAVLGSGTVSAKAGESGMCTIAIATDVLAAGELEVKAVVTV